MRDRRGREFVEKQTNKHSINDQITAGEVRVIGVEGEQLGVIKTEDALKMAEDAIRAYIASMKKHGEDVVDDSKTLESMLSLEYA